MAVALLSLVGLFVSLYLYLYKLGKVGALVCGTGGCETVQLSSWSRVFGIEVSLIGLLGYALLLGIALYSLRPTLAERPGPTRLLAALAGGGVAFSIYLTSLELFVIHAICRWCVASAIIITAIFVAVLLDSRRFASRVVRA